MVGVSGTGIQPVNTTTGGWGYWAWITIPEGVADTFHLKFTFVTWPCLDILQISIWVFLGDDGAKLNLT